MKNKKKVKKINYKQLILFKIKNNNNHRKRNSQTFKCRTDISILFHLEIIVVQETNRQLVVNVMNSKEIIFLMA